MRSSAKWSSNIAILLAAGVVLTVIIAAFYWLARPTLTQNATVQQQTRAERIQRDLASYLQRSQQIGQSTAALIAPLRDDPALVEATLTRMLASAPPETVYGIGAWFEPNVFTPTAALFGPYVHRVSLSDATPMLTYEWTTEAYHFPSQPWYSAGRSSNGQTVFTEPYFDTDMVYMSIIQPFFNQQGQFTGVVSVDLVLPQLRAIINQANPNADEVVYVVTPSGKVFAHPDEALILAFMQEQGQPVASLLDVTEDDLARFVAEGPASRRHTTIKHYRTDARIDQANWDVIIAADEATVFRSIANLRNSLILALVILWGSLGGMAWLLYRNRSHMRAAQEVIEQGKHQYRELFNQAPYPIVLVEESSRRFALVNDAALTFYGYEPEAFSAMTLDDLRANRDDPIGQAYGGENTLFADHHRKQNGAIADVLVRSQRITIDGIPHLKCYIVDTSEQKQAEEQIQRQHTLIQSQKKALARASTPLIPIGNRAIALPLIGVLSEDRAHTIIDVLTEGVAAYGARMVLLDLTGLETMDTAGANLLLRATQTIRLLGAKVAVTGIQPEIAQTLVALGVDVKTLLTYNTLQTGIAHVLRQSAVGETK